MPYEGEFASYKPLRRIVEAERVRDLLKKSKAITPAQSTSGSLTPSSAPAAPEALPDYAFAIDGSYTEIDIRNGYPGAKLGYVTVASVLLDLKRVDELDESRPVDPREFRKTEEASTLDAAMPGCNIVTRTHTSAVESFREALYENLLDVVVESGEGHSLLDTYEVLLAKRSSSIACPYRERASCECEVAVSPGASSCPCSHKYPIYSTDALRIHERFHDNTSNGEAFGEVMQVWERLLLVHLLRWFERQGLLAQLSRIAFLLDGPLAMFGHPAWLSPLIKRELKRLNSLLRDQIGKDLLIIGIEKSGSFVTHFEEVDRTETGKPLFPKGTYTLLSDSYIKERIIFSNSDKPYGQDTYFGRKFLYKTKSGAQIVGTIPMLDDLQDDTAGSDATKYPSFGAVCGILDKLVSSRFPNSVGPIISAHSHAAIPLTLGTKVLEQLARALVKK